MTQLEFLKELSIKAQEIVIHYLRMYPNISLEVKSGNVNKIRKGKSSHYAITLKTESKQIMEYEFLHEFFHAVQFEEGFPSVVAKQEEYVELATFLSSYILDLDIRARLEEYGYYQDLSNISKLVQSYIVYLNKIKQINNKVELMDMENQLSIAAILITSDIACIDNTELKNAVEFVRPQVMNYYKIFRESLCRFSYRNKEGAKKIYQYLVDEFGLNDVVEINNK